MMSEAGKQIAALDFTFATYLESRWREGYLEIHRYWRSRPLFLAVGLQELDLRGYLGLLHARHPLDSKTVMMSLSLQASPPTSQL